MFDTELSAREKQQLLSVLREMDTTAPAEQREHDRRRVLLDLVVRKVGGRRGLGPVKGKLVNVSLRGVGLLMETSVDHGDKLVLPLRFKEGGGWLALCEVKNCSLTDDGYRVGARLMDRVEDPDGEGKVPLDWLV